MKNSQIVVAEGVNTVQALRNLTLTIQNMFNGKVYSINCLSFVPEGRPPSISLPQGSIALMAIAVVEYEGDPLQFDIKNKVENGKLKSINDKGL